MLQAEIGSAKVTAAKSFPTRGHLMPDFTLSSSDGKQVSLYDNRGRSKLVLFFSITRAKPDFCFYAAEEHSGQAPGLRYSTTASSFLVSISNPACTSSPTSRSTSSNFSSCRPHLLKHEVIAFPIRQIHSRCCGGESSYGAPCTSPARVVRHC